LDAALLALRLAIAVVFLLAGLAKLANLDAFTRAVANYRLLPARAVRPVARALPAAEVAAGVLLLTGVATRLVALALAALLLAFAAAVAVNLRRGRRIDCGCFTGPGPREITWATVARNLAMSAGAVLLAARPPAALSLWAGPGAGGHLAGTAAAAAACTALVALCATRLAGAALELTRAEAALVKGEGGAP
jgi:uncharacterized membrane protein YphA (DoxX/SURF4 family)